MRNLTIEDRKENFERKFPNYASLVVHNDALYTTWVVGADYRKNTDFYGAYPYKVKERILALFPDCKKIMHLFSGTIEDNKQDRLDSEAEVVTYDISPKFDPTICDDVRNLKDYRDIFERMDLVMADPPYEKKDFEKYDEEPFDKAQVIRNLGDVMKSGSFLAWLDTRVPIWSKETWVLRGHIGLVISTNHRVRMWSLWEHK